MWGIIIGCVVVLLGASIVYSQYVKNSANEGITFSEHIKGNPEAQVTLIEYSDFQCPACGQFYPYIKEVIEEHGDNLRFEYRHFPLLSIHPYALKAAHVAEAAGQQGEFFAMHDMLFENQSTWSQSTNPDAYFNQYAEEIGLDMGTFERHMNASVIDDKIKESFNDARSRGFTGTPTLLLNGNVMEFETFQEFKDQIKSAIESTS